MSFSESIFSGRIVKDAEIRRITSGKGGAVLNFSIAVSKKSSGEKDPVVHFHRCVWFFSKDEAATQMAKYLYKGRPVIVRAEISYSTENGYNKDRKKISFKNYSFIVRDIEFLPTAKKEDHLDATAQGMESKEKFEGDEGFEENVTQEKFEGDEGFEGDGNVAF